MTWHETADVEEYLAAAGDLLFPEPGINSVALTVCTNARARPDGTRFAWWQEESLEVTGAVSRTPPFPVLLAAVPDHAVAPLLDLWPVEAVNGRTELAVQVAALAAARKGATARVHRASRLFQLDRLVTPDVRGSARLAVGDDAPLLERWVQAFVEETDNIADDVPAMVRDRLGYQGFVLWDDGGPRACASLSREAFGAIRIGPVYTPPEHRAQGYGGAVTAAASRRALDLGAAQVVLYTDLTNPTSNALYPRLGYRRVHDSAHLVVG